MTAASKRIKLMPIHRDVEIKESLEAVDEHPGDDDLMAMLHALIRRRALRMAQRAQVLATLYPEGVQYSIVWDLLSQRHLHL